MNRHIEDYLKLHHCRDYFNSYGETVEDDHYFMYREEVDGLIELIVKECAEVAGCNGHVSGFTLSDLIKQHFGIPL
jgi:hypothetical protein